MLWPASPFYGSGPGFLSVGRDFCFVGLAVGIGFSSARLGAGQVLSSWDVLLHLSWTILMLASLLFAWGPFRFRLQSSSGSMEEFALINRLDPVLRAIQAAVLMAVYSGIPLGVTRLARESLVQYARPANASLPKILSVTTFALAVFTAWILRRAWHGSEVGAGLIVGVLLFFSFGLLGVLGARGDRAATGILLLEAGLFGLLRFA